MAVINMDVTPESQDRLDVLKAAQRLYPNRGKISIMIENQHFRVVDKWFYGDRHQVQGGTAIMHTMSLADGTGNARFSGPNEVDNTDLQNVRVELTTPWRHIDNSYIITHDEMVRCRGGAATVNMLKSRRMEAGIYWANLVENRGFIAPHSSTDDLNPYGLAYHLVPFTSAQVAAHAAALSAGTEHAVDTGDHQGANPSGFSTYCGLDTSLSKNELARNYNDVWTNSDMEITEDDVEKILRAFRHLSFRAPMNVENWSDPNSVQFTGYIPEALLSAINKKARTNNESLGADLGKFADGVVVKGMPIMWAKQLDNDTSNPMFIVNNRHFYPVFQKGEFLRETPAIRVAGKHNQYVTFDDTMFNFICENRRAAGANISYVA